MGGPSDTEMTKLNKQAGATPTDGPKRGKDVEKEKTQEKELKIFLEFRKIMEIPNLEVLGIHGNSKDFGDYGNCRRCGNCKKTKQGKEQQSR